MKSIKDKGYGCSAYTSQVQGKVLKNPSNMTHGIKKKKDRRKVFDQLSSLKKKVSNENWCPRSHLILLCQVQIFENINNQA